MLRAVACLCWTLALFGQTDELRNPRTTPADVAAGAKTFRSHCAECHGLNAEGGRGPSLTTGIFYHGSSDAELLKNISDGIAGTEMPGLFYSPDRVWQVVAYLRSLNDNGRNGLRGNVENGRALFRSTGCGQCHRVQGEGGRMGPDLTLIGAARSARHLREALANPAADVRQRYWTVQFTADSGQGQSGFLLNEDTYTVQFITLGGELQSVSKSGLKDYRIEKSSRMPSYKDRLSDGQIDDLVAYLASLRPVAQRGAR
jgi:cytochrome c oxidase cbb3-type subunit III